MRKNLPFELKFEVLAQAAPPCEVCGEPTSLARFAEVRGKRVGQFAHVRGIAPGAARHDAAYPPERVDSAENLFWSCTDCHSIVDSARDPWPIARLLERLKVSRDRRGGAFLVIEADIEVSGQQAESVTGIDAGGKPTILKAGTTVRVSGTDVRNITGVKS